MKLIRQLKLLSSEKRKAISEQPSSFRGKQLPFDNEYLKEEIIKTD